MKTKSVKSYTGIPFENLRQYATESDPLGIIDALERNFIAPLPFITKLVPLTDVIRQDPVMGFMAEAIADMHARIEKKRASRTATKMLHSHFGKYLEKDEQKMLAEQLDGLTDNQDQMNAIITLIDRIKSRRAWKAEQSAHQHPQHYKGKEPAMKELIDGKMKWNDATVHELPPLTGHGKSHEPAVYAMKLPDGRIVNLGQNDGEHAAVRCKYPSVALRHIGTRLGIEMRGGDTAVLNAILKADMVEWEDENGNARKDYKFLPSYCTIWTGKVWVVYVGWRKNPKCHFSKFWVDGDQLTERPNEFENPLTMSQLDYTLLTGTAEEKLEADPDNPDDEPTDWLNDEEEYVAAGLAMEDNEEDIPIDNPLLTAYAYENDRFIELRNGSAVWNDKELRQSLAQMGRRIIAEKHRMQRFADDIKDRLSAETSKYVFADKDMPEELIARWKQLHTMEHFIKTSFRRFRDQLEDLFSQMKPRNESVPERDRFTMKGTPNHLPAKEPVKVQDCFHAIPLNRINHVERQDQSDRLLRSRPFRCNLDDAKQLRRLKQTAANIIHGRFHQTLRNQSAANEFERAIEKALRA